MRQKGMPASRTQRDAAEMNALRQKLCGLCCLCRSSWKDPSVILRVIVIESGLLCTVREITEDDNDDDRCLFGGSDMICVIYFFFTTYMPPSHHSGSTPGSRFMCFLVFCYDCRGFRTVQTALQTAFLLSSVCHDLISSGNGDPDVVVE